MLFLIGLIFDLFDTLKLRRIYKFSSYFTRKSKGTRIFFQEFYRRIIRFGINGEDGLDVHKSFVG